MTDGEAFFQAIIDDPDNDQVRLVYADWLEEQGQMARAEFIRLQCELATLSKDDPRFRKLTKRELEMIRNYKEEWFGELRKKFGFWECHRGFWSEVSATSIENFLQIADQLFGSHPVQHVGLNGVDDRVKELAQCPYLARLTSLTFYWGQNFGDDGVRAFVQSPFLTRLTRLKMDSCQITDAGAEMLSTAPQLGNLTVLDLRRNAIEARGALALASSIHLQNIRELHLSNNPVPELTKIQLRRRHGRRIIFHWA